MINNKDKYIKFPLCLLASSKEFEKVLLNVFGYFISVFCNNGTNEELMYYKDLEFSKYAPSDFEGYENEEQLLLVGALNYFQIKIQSIIELQKIYLEMEQYVKDFENKHGKDAYAKVHRDVFLETVKGEFAGKYSERYFRTLASITAILGTNQKYPFKRITKDRILFGFYGYKSEVVYHAEFSDRTTITKRQLSTTIDKLVERNLIRKIIRKRRLSYYSTQLSFEELAEAIAQHECQQLEKKNKQAIADQYIKKRIDEMVCNHNFLN